MSIRLIVEVMDNAPPQIGHTEWRLLVVLAEQANDKTRLCWPDLDLLTRRVGVSASGIRQAMLKLAALGLEVRVSSRTDKNGDPVFAHRGSQRTYRIPTVEAFKGASTQAPKPRPKVPESRQKAGPKVPESASKGASTQAPFPSVPLKEQRHPSNFLTDATASAGADVDLFGDPIEPPNPVPLIVAGYVDSVRETGGVATSAMCGAIGRNAKRLIEVDKLHPAVVLVAAQRAGAKRAKTLDQFLGDAQQTYDRDGQSRRAMFDNWKRAADLLTLTQRPELGA